MRRVGVEGRLTHVERLGEDALELRIGKDEPLALFGAEVGEGGRGSGG